MRCFTVAVVGPLLDGMETWRSGREAEKRTVISKVYAPSFSGYVSGPRCLEGTLRLDMDVAGIGSLRSEERARCPEPSIF